MEQNTTYVHSGELYHYGRKGMKWGQNIFGKRRTSAKGKVVAKKKADSKVKEAEPKKKKPLSEMSDDEIRKAVDRKRLENEYRSLYPQKVSWGKKFASEFLDKSIKPALIDGGKQILTNMLKQYGDNLIKKDSEPSKMDKLKDKAEIAKLEKTILERDKAKIDLDKAKKTK